MAETLKPRPYATPRRIPGLHTAEWMAFQSGLPPRLRSDPALAAFVRRTKWWRRITFFGGLLLPYAWLVVTGSDGPVPNFFVVWVTAWFAARILPELFARHRRPGATRVATLGNRSLLRYVPDTGRRWLLASYALGAIAIVVGRIWPAARSVTMPRRSGSRRSSRSSAPRRSLASPDVHTRPAAPTTCSSTTPSAGWRRRP